MSGLDAVDGLCRAGQTLVSRTGLKNCEPISQLSKMQKQRVGLASSLVTIILVLA